MCLIVIVKMLPGRYAPGIFEIDSAKVVDMGRQLHPEEQELVDLVRREAPEFAKKALAGDAYRWPDNRLVRVRLAFDNHGRSARYGFAFTVVLLAFFVVDTSKAEFGGCSFVALTAAQLATLRFAGLGPAWLSSALIVSAVAWFLPPADSLAADDLQRVVDWILGTSLINIAWPGGTWDWIGSHYPSVSRIRAAIRSASS
jgi:hypothetical protein